MNEAWFFTFGSGHYHGPNRLCDRYVIIEGTHDEARHKICEVRGPKWACQYPVSDLERQITQFNLRETTLEELVV